MKTRELQARLRSASLTVCTQCARSVSVVAEEEAGVGVVLEEAGFQRTQLGIDRDSIKERAEDLGIQSDKLLESIMLKAGLEEGCVNQIFTSMFENEEKQVKLVTEILKASPPGPEAATADVCSRDSSRRASSSRDSSALVLLSSLLQLHAAVATALLEVREGAGQSQNGSTGIDRE